MRQLSPYDARVTEDLDPFLAANRHARKKWAVSIGATVGTLVILFGGYKLFHEPTDSERLEAERDEFGGIVQDVVAVHEPHGDPKDAVGRKVLIVSFATPDQRSLKQVPAGSLAKKAKDVGLVVIADTVEDPTKSITYTDGSHGYGGVSTYRAITYPEKRVVAELVTHCTPSFSVYKFGSATSDSHCYYDSAEYATFVSEVIAGKTPRRHSSDPKYDADLELDSHFGALASEMAAVAPRALPRGPLPANPKFLVVEEREARQERLLTIDLRATQPEDVNVVISWSAWDDKAHMFAFTRASPHVQLGARSVPCRANITPCGPSSSDIDRFANAVSRSDASAFMDEDAIPAGDD
jgi:hypothetical protein